ncbi:MAG: hypothetical protein FWG42_07415 [Clostridiales bacterium]|nr:hypothetical protein [Clostridiales bacterium]
MQRIAPSKATCSQATALNRLKGRTGGAKPHGDDLRARIASIGVGKRGSGIGL